MRDDHECRRCSECDGMSHHWIPDPQPLDDPEYMPGDYACKHCDYRGDGCETCAGDGYLDGDESKPCERCSQEGVVPLLIGPTDLAIRTIIDNWIDWDGRVGQISARAKRRRWASVAA